MNVEDKERDASMILPRGRINVLLPIPISQYYEYLSTELSLRIGDLVQVPFGKRQLPALVMGSSNGRVDTLKLKSVISKYDLPSLIPEMMDFVIWVSAYNMVPAGSVLKMVLSAPDALGPPRQIKAFLNALDMEKRPAKLTPGRKRVLEYLAENKPRTIQEIVEFAKVTPAVIKGLHRLGSIDALSLIHI